MIRRRKFLLKLPGRTLALGERTLVMGVLNATPDSFSDGGKFLNPNAAVRRALEMEAQGADIIDIGGESTRPGSEPVSAEVEMARVMPVVERLRGRLRIPISIDTQKAAVAQAALAAGAEIVNDVSALRADREMGAVVRREGAALVLMHMRGRPKTMQQRPFARDVVGDVTRGLRAAFARARRAGIARSRIVLDPGIGFGKSAAQNWELLARLEELARLGYPLLVGTSRKSFLGTLGAGAIDPERLTGTAATVVAAVLGGAHIVRVHDVEQMVRAARAADAIVGGDKTEKDSGRRGGLTPAQRPAYGLRSSAGRARCSRRGAGTG